MSSFNPTSPPTPPSDSEARKTTPLRTSEVTPNPHVAKAPTESDLGDFKVWSPPKSAVTTPGSLPDSYFEPTPAELRAAFAAQTRTREKLVDAPLKTRELREREEKAKAARYPTTTIRIKFPNQLQLEKKFPSTDKIKSVYAFVRNSLTDDAKPIKFVLYQPPKRELKVSDPQVKPLSLYELQLSPSSVLLLRFESDELNHSYNPPPLLPSILARSKELPPPPSFDPAPPEEADKDKGKGKGSGNVLGGGSGSSNGDGTVKKPKWLKLK